MADTPHRAIRNVPTAAGIWRPGTVRSIDPTDPAWAGHVARGALVAEPATTPAPKRRRPARVRREAPALTYGEAVAADLAEHPPTDPEPEPTA